MTASIDKIVKGAPARTEVNLAEHYRVRVRVRVRVSEGERGPLVVPVRG